jgi:hypothetical protein
MHYSIVVFVCPMNFFYVFIEPGPFLRHLGEFGKNQLLLGENTRLILTWSRSMKLNISGDIRILSDFRHLA